jgi:transcription antitermination factor NusG
MLMASSERKWFVLYTKPKFEKKVYGQLLEKNIESFLPLQEVVKQWSDRKKKVEEPLFPGYVFIHSNEKERLLSLGTIGVVKCINFKGRLAVVNDFEIENIKKLLAFGKMLEVHSSMAIGTRVKIIRGPLNGMEGLLTEVRGGKRFTISIEDLTSSISIEIPIEDLEKIDDNKSRN